MEVDAPKFWAKTQIPQVKKYWDCILWATSNRSLLQYRQVQTAFAQEKHQNGFKPRRFTSS